MPTQPPKKSLGSVISDKTSPPARSKSLRECASSLKRSIFQAFAPFTPTTHQTPPTFVLFGILGVAGSLKAPDVRWMATDFMVWASLLYDKPGFDPSRSKSLAICEVFSHFEKPTYNDKVISDEAGCDRLRFPIPGHLEFLTKDSPLSAPDFVTDCIISLAQTADTIKSNETLVILLIGHGTVSETGEFLFCVTTKHGRQDKACISKYTLECILEHCKGDIVIICNSSCSERLESPRWTLLCAAGLNQFADSLSQSGSESGLTLSAALVQTGCDQAIELLLPRSEKSLPVESMAQLLDTPPPPGHPFSSSSQSLSELTNCPLPVFIEKLLQVEKSLVIRHEAECCPCGGSEVLLWHHILPLNNVVGQIQEQPGEGSKYWNGVFHPSVLHDSTIITEDLQLDKKLLPLAEAYVKLPHSHSPFTYEWRVSARCYEFLQQTLHSDQSHPLTESDVSSLIYTLHSRNVQSMVVQGVAKRLGWWDGPRSEFLPFLPLEQEGGARKEMVNSGFDLDEFIVRMLRFFDGMWGVRYDASANWLAKRWVEAGRPSLTQEEWYRAVDAEAEAAVGTVL